MERTYNKLVRDRIPDIIFSNNETPVTREERYNMILRHYRLMLENKPEHIAVKEMRKHIGWYIKGIRGAGKFRAEVNRCDDSSAALSLIDHFFSIPESMLPEREGEQI